ncbi:MAG: hypothetical protein WKF88_01875 [Ferruginibacter sp.]
MKIAILGWGSLIWQPKDLKIDTSIGDKGWFTDGPLLPIEFARISKNRRLTLVIKSDALEQTTLYAFSIYPTTELAVLDLALREGTCRNSIGSYERGDNKLHTAEFGFVKRIKDWLEEHEGIDAVVWTNLGEKMFYENDKAEKVPVTDPILYLKGLKGEASVLAEEYIRKTPKQINTLLRTKIEKELGWLPI